MSSAMKCSPSSQEEAPAAVPGSRPQALNQSSPAPPSAGPAGRVHRNMRRTTPRRNNSSPYGGRQAGNSQMMQQPVRYGNHYQNNTVPVQVIMNNGSGVLISYDYMGWNYCWSVTGSWTLTMSPSTYPPLRFILPSPQHPNRPAPVNNNRAAPIPAPPTPENSPAAPPALPALPAAPDQPNQPDDLDLDSSLHL